MRSRTNRKKAGTVGLRFEYRRTTHQTLRCHAQIGWLDWLLKKLGWKAPEHPPEVIADGHAEELPSPR